MYKDRNKAWEYTLCRIFFLTDNTANIHRLVRKLGLSISQIIKEDWAWLGMEIDIIEPLIISKQEIINAILDKANDKITTTLISGEICSAIFQKLTRNMFISTGILDAIVVIELCELVKMIKVITEYLLSKTQIKDIAIDTSGNLHDNLLEYIIVIETIGSLMDLVSCASILIFMYVLHYYPNCVFNNIAISEQHLNILWRELHHRTRGRVKQKIIHHEKQQ